MPQSQATAIFQDSRGFMWIGTRNGLSRFDGTDIINYFRKDGLPSNFVSVIFEDTGGDIWALASEGLSRYDGRGFVFFPLSAGSEKYSFSHNVTYDNNNNIYLLAGSSVYPTNRLLIFKDGIYSDYSAKYQALDTLGINEIYFYHQLEELLIIDKAMQFWCWKNEKLDRLSLDKAENLRNDRGKILVNQNETTFEYIKGDFKVLPPVNETVWAEARNNIVKKASIKDYFDKRLINYLNLPFVATGNYIDNEGVVWFASESNINRLLSTAFTSFSDDDIPAKNIWAIAEDKNGHIWFGSLYTTLIEYDGKTFRERNEYKPLFVTTPGFYKGSRRMFSGDIWFSTSMGVLIWDGKTFSRLKSIPDKTQICYIYEDPDNKTVMLGTEKGLFIIKNGRVNLIPDFNDTSLGVIEGIAKDDNGNYWLSGHRGIVRFDGYNSIPVRENVLPNGYTYTIKKDNFGGIWVTSEEGLYFRGKSSESFIHGLPEAVNKPANSIILMDSIHLLVGRVSDICIIDLDKFYRNDKNYFRSYDNTDGFTGSDCLDNGIIKDQQGRYWILSSDNVVVFDPGMLKRNPHPPKLNITGFYYQNDSLDWVPVGTSDFFYKMPDNIMPGRNQNKIQITFSGISTTNPEKVTYQCRLLGYDDKWSLPANKRFVVYEKLPPGQYSFQLKATNADGVETPEPLVLQFKVLPSFWQTPLFWVISFILSLIITVTVTLQIMKRVQLKKEEKARLRSELSRLQMSSVLRQFDPHFTFNVISSVGSLIMKGERETAYNYITRLSGLIRTVLTDGSLIIKPLSVELDFVNKYCELQKLRFKDRFIYNIYVNENIDLQRDIPKMTIQTFVENAIKHGFENRKEGGKVDIHINNNEKNLEIQIVDNGIGRAAAARQRSGGTGRGLKIIEGLFDMLNAKNSRPASVVITDLENNGKPSGTEVKIIIPDGYRFNSF